MPHEKECKSCGQTFVGFTPICKDCNAKRGEGQSLPSVISSEPSPLTSQAEPPRPEPERPEPQASAPPPPSSSAFSMNKPKREGGRGGYNGGGRGDGGSEYTEHEKNVFRNNKQGNRNNNSNNNSNYQNNQNGGSSAFNMGRGRGRGGGGPSNRKTQVCRNFPNCKFSDEECNYIHPAQSNEAFSHLKKVCQQFKREGTCKYGARCHFTHDPSTLPKRDPTKDARKITDSAPVFGVTQQRQGAGGGDSRALASQGTTQWRSDE